MKAVSNLCFRVVVCLCVLLSSVRAQLRCDPNSNIGNNLAQLLPFLQNSPGQNCTSQIMAIVQVRDFIKEAQTVFRALPVICESECLAFAHNLTLNCLPSYVNVLGLACGKNEQQQFCYDTVQRDNGTNLQMSCFRERFIPNSRSVRMRDTVTEQPATNTSTTAASPTGFTCNDECSRALRIFRGLHGCCVSNVFNSSTFGLLELGLANYSLWSACGVETVMGNCSSPFGEQINPTTESTNTLSTASSFKFAAHSSLTVFALLVTLILR